MISPPTPRDRQLIADILNRARIGWRVAPSQVISIATTEQYAIFALYDEWMYPTTITLCKNWVRETVKRLKAIFDYSERTLTRPEIKIQVYIEPETVKPETRLEFYTTPDPNKYVCLSFNPKRVFPERYEIGKYPGSNLQYCTCPHHQKRQVYCKHLKGLSEQVVIEREPVRLEQTTFPKHLNPVFRAYIGNDSIAIISASYHGIWGHSLPSGLHQWATPELAAQAAADEWWENQRIETVKERELVIARMEEDLARF